MLPGWEPLADVARRAAERDKTTTRTQRNRILAVNHALGGNLVRSFQRSGPTRKWWVCVVALEEALRTDPEVRTAEVDWLASRVEKLEQTSAVFKKSIRQLKKQQLTFADWMTQRKTPETVGSQTQHPNERP